MTEGPCYDFCSCRHCWWGWKAINPLKRIWWRLQYILEHGYDG